MERQSSQRKDKLHRAFLILEAYKQYLDMKDIFLIGLILRNIEKDESHLKAVKYICPEILLNS